MLRGRELCSQWVCNKHCLGRISLLHGDRCLGMRTGKSTSPHTTICSSLFSVLDGRQSQPQGPSHTSKAPFTGGTGVNESGFSGGREAWNEYILQGDLLDYFTQYNLGSPTMAARVLGRHRMRRLFCHKAACLSSHLKTGMLLESQWSSALESQRN